MESNNNSWREPNMLGKVFSILAAIFYPFAIFFVCTSMIAAMVKATTSPLITISVAAQSAADRACANFYPGSTSSGGYFGTKTCWVGSEAGSKKVGEIEYIINPSDLAKGKAESDAIWNHAFWPFDLPFSKNK